jgi:hypothetical protein
MYQKTKDKSEMRRVLPLLVFLCLSSPLPGGDLSPEPEANVSIAKTWWPDQRNVWTPIGWKDHFFRFNVLYNGTVLFEPCSGWTSREHAKEYRGRDAQLTFTPWPDTNAPGVPKERIQLWKLDGGHGLQGWRTNSQTPVLWTKYPLNEGLVIEQEVFAHVSGGKKIESGLEPLFAWIRLKVTHVDPLRAPAMFPVIVQLSRNYHEHNQRYMHEDGITIDVNPERAAYQVPLSAVTNSENGKHLLRVLESDQNVRLVAVASKKGKVEFFKRAEGVYGLKVNLAAKVGDSVDLLFPALPVAQDLAHGETALGFDGALAESEPFWAYKPPTAATFDVPEQDITRAIEQSVKFAQVVAERDPITREYSMLSGSWGYDQLWSTPTSMNSHMFLSWLGYHDLVAKYSELFRANQGSVKPPGPTYEKHPGYYSSPKNLTAFDWLSDHGAILLQISTHALLSDDQEFAAQWSESIVKACDFIRDACLQTNHDGVAGLLPPAVATDEIIPTQALWTLAWNNRGLQAAVRFLERVRHPRASEFKRFADEYRTIFEKAFRQLSEKAPVWVDESGRSRVKPPTTLSSKPMPWHPFSDAFYLDTGPMVLVWGGLMNADDELIRSTVEFFRNGPNAKLYGTRYHPLCRPILMREISTCEPCYSWNVFHSWQLGERKPFLEGLYSLFVGALSQQTYISCEHRHGMQGNLFVIPTAFTVARLAVLDDQIVPGELHLLRLCPLAWVTAARETVLENMPTEYGPIDLRFRLSPDHTRLEVRFSGKWRQEPAGILLHTPPFQGLKEISVNGTVHAAGKILQIK